MQLLSSAVLAGGGSVIDLDGTFLVHIVLFFLTLLLLRALVFKPMIALFQAREDAIDGARAEAREMQKEASKKADAFEDEMRQVRLEAGAERDKLRQEGVRLERAILEKVRKETQASVAAAEEKLAREAAQLRREIDQSVPLLARDITKKLLGREVS